VPRFPTRTLVLMVLSLLSFGWMWWRTHLVAAKGPQQPVQVIVITDGGTP